MSGADELPWFLQRLALDGAADQRAIRRAYAREVKRIDQAVDAEGFQLLRAAYETALGWEAYQRAVAQQEAAQAGSGADCGMQAAGGDGAGQEEARAPQRAAASGAGKEPGADGNAADGSASPATVAARGGMDDTGAPHDVAGGIPLETIDPQQLSADVFEAFIAGCSALAQGRTMHDAAAWEQHLRTCLHDERLMNLAARGIFEARIVHLLAAGWRPGHETLLEAAADVFQWRADRHRLNQFGHAGAIVDRAIDERSMFDNQDRDDKAAQRQVIGRLREPDTPDAQQLRADMPHAEQLAARFPTWLELVASMENLEQWRTAYAALPEEMRRLRFVVDESVVAPAPPPRRSPWHLGSRAFAVLLLLALLRVAFQWAEGMAESGPSTGRAPELAQQSKLDREYDALQRQYAAAREAAERSREQGPGQQRGGREAGGATEPKAAAAAPPVYTDPSRERIEEIRSRIRYRLTHAEPPGKYRAEFNVGLDGKGRISRVDLHKSSGLPNYDAAVEQAIRGTEPFPPGTAPRFRLMYGMEIILKPPAPPREPEPATPAAPEAPPQ